MFTLNIYSSNFKKTNLILLGVLLQLFIILFNWRGSFYNLSFYYQIINYLNTKNNLILLLLLVVLLLQNKKKNTNKIFSILFLFFWIHLYNIPVEINQLCITHITNKQSINTNLLNGIMLIHPPILYGFYILCLWYMGIHIHIKITKKVAIQQNHNHKIEQVLLIYTSIILGCLWAEQELSWGGWWSWDFVELIALNFLIYSLYGLHTTNKICNKTTYTKFCMFVVAIICVRFNIINSIHNFVDSESQHQYLYYIMVCINICLLYIYFFVKKRIYNKKLSIGIFFLIILSILYIFYIYIILIVDFFQIKYNLQTNIKQIYTYIYLSALLLFFLKTHKNTIKYLGVLYFLNFGFITAYLTMWCLKVFISKNKNNALNTTFVKILHTLALFLFVCTIQQTYVFYPDLPFIFLKNMVLIKPNFIENITEYNTCNVYTTPRIKKYTLIARDLYENSFDFSSGNFKIIFEKNIFFLTSVVVELYNYNLQKLMQPAMGLIFVVLVLILGTSILLNSRKKIFFL